MAAKSTKSLLGSADKMGGRFWMRRKSLVPCITSPCSFIRSLVVDLLSQRRSLVLFLFFVGEHLWAIETRYNNKKALEIAADSEEQGHRVEMQ